MIDPITAIPAPEEIDAPTSAAHPGPTPPAAPAPTSGRDDYDAAVKMNMLMPGEPWFLVKGHDPAFAAAVRAYAAEIHRLGGPLENVESALQLADKGERFEPKRMPDSVREHDHERKQLRYQLSQRLRFTSLVAQLPPGAQHADVARDLLKVAKAGLKAMERDLRCTLESGCLLDPATHEPRRETLDEVFEAEVAALEAYIEWARSFIALAEGQF
jgi:hypothetical protein